MPYAICHMKYRRRTRMPTTKPGSASGNLNIRRYAFLAFVVAAVAIAFDRTGASAQDEKYRRITRDDCSYLQDPDTFRGALANHRDMVSRSTETVSLSIVNAIDEQTEISLVPPQDIPRKNIIHNILLEVG